MQRDTQRDRLVACLPMLRAYVRRIAGTRHEAAELLQEVSVRILAGFGPPERERFLAWSCGIARHVLAYDWRERKRSRAELTFDGDSLEQVRAPQFDYESQLDARAWVARAVVQLEGEAHSHRFQGSTGLPIDL